MRLRLPAGGGSSEGAGTRQHESYEWLQNCKARLDAGAPAALFVAQRAMSRGYAQRLSTFDALQCELAINQQLLANADFSEGVACVVGTPTARPAPARRLRLASRRAPEPPSSAASPAPRCVDLQSAHAHAPHCRRSQGRAADLGAREHSGRQECGARQVHRQPDRRHSRLQQAGGAAARRVSRTSCSRHIRGCSRRSSAAATGGSAVIGSIPLI